MRNLDRRSGRLHKGGLALAALVATCLYSVAGLPGGQSPEGGLRLGDLGRSKEGTLEAPLTLAGFEEGLTGLQFDLVSRSRDLQLVGRLSSQLEQGGKSLHVRRLGPGVFRFLITGLNQSEIEPGAVAIVTLASGDSSQSAIIELSIQRVIGTDSQGRRLAMGVARRPGTDRDGPQGTRSRSRQP